MDKIYQLCFLFFIISLFFTPSLMNTRTLGFELKHTFGVAADVSVPDWYEKPNNYSQLVYWYQSLESSFPQYLEVFKANELYNTGKADGGYDLYYVRITNESRGFHKPEVFFLGSPHGDETVGTIGLFWFTHWFLRKTCTDEPCDDYAKDWLKWLMDHREIYIGISQNPYGFDHNRRLDINGWDLNREADYDGPGQPTGGIWGSINGKTLRAFIDNHTIRVGCDFHGGARMILYPWSSTYAQSYATSHLSGKGYSYAPPDFHFFDISSLRLGSYMGSYGGVLDERSIGPIPVTVGYEAPGAISPWAYAANVNRHHQEDVYVNDEVFGNYPGTGILWLSPEMSRIKNPTEQSFGNDTVDRYGAEVRRFVLHQTDLAQPSVRWISPTDDNLVITAENPSLTLKWQVNGSLVVDETYLQWDINSSDVIQNPIWRSENKALPKDKYHGGTGWDDASQGSTKPVTYEQTIHFPAAGEYVIAAKASVDQIYKQVLQSSSYDDFSYLRLVQERTNDSFYERINGKDGIEQINGSTWWYSPLIQVHVAENNTDFDIVQPTKAVYLLNKKISSPVFLSKPIVFGPIDIHVDVYADASMVEMVRFSGDDQFMEDDELPYVFSWDEKTFGYKEITIKVMFKNGIENEKTFGLWKFF